MALCARRGCVHLALFLSLFFILATLVAVFCGPLSLVSCKFGSCFRLPLPLSSFCLLLPPALLAEVVAFPLVCNFWFSLWFSIFDFVFWVCVLVFILPHLFSFVLSIAVWTSSSEDFPHLNHVTCKALRWGGW